MQMRTRNYFIFCQEVNIILRSFRETEFSEYVYFDDKEQQWQET